MADEKRILDALGRGLLKDFPNPNRIGCPGAEVLKKIASRELPLSEAEKWLDHLGSCSPCYRDFSQFRAEYRQRRTRIILAAAASVLIIVGLTTWEILRQHNSGQISAVVDLRDRSMTRGTEAPPSEAPIEIPRKISHLDIYLPFGSSDGSYDVRIAGANSNLLFNTTGVATVKSGITLLRVEANLRLVPGSYVLQIRKAGSDWNSYRANVK